ncbi:MAG: hypothetical protein EOO01_33850, partial [Chitinophagaceae bacterium]
MRNYIGKQIISVYTIEFIKEYRDSKSTPFAFLFLFNSEDTFMRVELNEDADHINVESLPTEILSRTLSTYSGEIFNPFDSTNSYIFRNVVNREITMFELAIDKSIIKSNNDLNSGKKKLFSGLRFRFNHDNLILFNNGDESYIGFNSKLLPAFPDTY